MDRLIFILLGAVLLSCILAPSAVVQGGGACSTCKQGAVVHPVTTTRTVLEIQNNLGRAITTSTSKWTSSRGVTTIGPATIASGSSKEFLETGQPTQAVKGMLYLDLGLLKYVVIKWSFSSQFAFDDQHRFGIMMFKDAVEAAPSEVNYNNPIPREFSNGVYDVDPDKQWKIRASVGPFAPLKITVEPYGATG